MIGGQAPNSAWTETDCLLHLQIHPKLQQMWQLLRLFFLRHWTNTYWFPNRDGLTTLVLWIISLWVGKSTRPTHQYQKPWQEASLQCQVDLQGHQHIWQALHTLWTLHNKSLHGSFFEENDATWCTCIAALIQQLYNCCYELEYSDRVACWTNPWRISHLIPAIKIWLSVRQLQWPSKIPESRSYLNEPFSKDYGEEPPSYTSSWLYRLYLFHLLAAPNLWNILLMIRAFRFHSEGR